MDRLIKELKRIYTRYLFFHQDEEMVLFLMKCVTLKWLCDHRLMDIDEETRRRIQNDFTIPTFMSLWSKKERRDITFYREERLILSDTMWGVVRQILEFEFDFSKYPSEILAEIYEALLPPVGKRAKGAFYTPQPLAQLMAKMLFSKIQLNPRASLKVLDPACGGGQLLSAVYDQMMSTVFLDEPQKGHQLLLENMLHGWDTEPLSVLVSSLVLVLKSDRYVSPRHIVQGDALFMPDNHEIDHSYDCIIGNPPYVGHKEIDRNYSEQLRQKYAPVYSDKADISYCFFMLGEQLLKKSGQLLFLTSRYFMEAHYGVALREYITDHFTIEMLIDFNGVRPIDRVGIDPAIIQLKKDQDDTSTFMTKRLDYTAGATNDRIIEDLKNQTGCYYSTIITDQKKLDVEVWRIHDEMTSGIVKKIEEKSLFYLEDLVDSFQGIITGCDKAFVLKAEDESDALLKLPYIHPWIKNKDVHAYGIDTPQLAAIYTNEIQDIKEHPVLEERLLPYRETLMRRRETQRGTLPWFHMQWGRELSKFKRTKIIYPYKAARNRFAIDQDGYLFSADVYGMVLKELLYVHVDECFLMLLLNSRLYTYYFQSYAKKLGQDLYEYYPNTLMRLRIPEVESKQLQRFQNNYRQYVNNMIDQSELAENFETWLHGFFDLSREESAMVLKETSNARKYV